MAVIISDQLIKNNNFIKFDANNDQVFQTTRPVYHKLLGEGGYKKVYSAKCFPFARKIAIANFRFPSLKDIQTLYEEEFIKESTLDELLNLKQKEDFNIIQQGLDEYNTLNKLKKYVGIIKVYNVFFKTTKDTSIFQIQMELFEKGDLDQALKKNVKFTQEDTFQIMSDLLHGIIGCFQEKILNSDIKPANIVLAKRNERYRAAFIDFGTVTLDVEDIGQLNMGTQNLFIIFKEIVSNKSPKLFHFVQKYSAIKDEDSMPHPSIILKELEHLATQCSIHLQ